jgi:imidazolonepropionase-like amidohydrolase
MKQKPNFFLPMLVLLFACLWALASTAQKTYLHCGQVIDVVRGETSKEKTILVEGNKIVAVQDGYAMPTDGSQVVNLKAFTVMPGWIDMHVHIESVIEKGSYINRFTLSDADVAYMAETYGENTLQAGFTTVRDLGGTGVNNAYKNAINKGLATGPRVFTSVGIISSTGGHGDPTAGAKKGLLDPPGPETGVADGTDDCKQAVRQMVKNGADVIKVTATGGVTSLTKDGFRPQFDSDELKAIVKTAADYGLKVAAHAHGDEGIRRAIEAGVTTIEHGSQMSPATMDLLIERGVHYVPTLTAGSSVSDSAKIPGYFPEIVRVKAIETGKNIQSVFSLLIKKGGKIAFGTDAGVFPHGKNALEFKYMNELGMAPMQCIQSATIVNARLLDMGDKLGSLDPGKLADIVAVPGDPLKTFSKMQEVAFVMKDGKIYKQ